MNDEMDVMFDHRLRSALHSASLPPAPASLRDALDALPQNVGTPRRSLPRRVAWGALAAGIAVVAFVAWGAIFGQGTLGPGGEATPTPTLSPLPPSSPTPSASPPTYDVYLVGQLLDRRADGTIGSEQVVVVGYFSDLRRSPVPCPSLSLAALELGCFDRRQGIIDDAALVGAYVDGRFEPIDAPVVHPHWPRALAADPETAALVDLIARTDPGSARPISVTVIGHFDDPLAADCPSAADPPCADRFVVDDVISFDDPYAVATPGPISTPFPFESPPPPPQWLDGPACTTSRAANGPSAGDPVNPGFTRAGWIPKTEIPYEMPFGSELLPEVVYYVEIAGDFPLGDWYDADEDRATESPDDFRWWGTATCIAYEDGVFAGWLPGSTYRLYRDGRRVDGGDPRDPLPTPTPAP